MVTKKRPLSSGLRFILRWPTFEQPRPGHKKRGTKIYEIGQFTTYLELESSSVILKIAFRYRKIIYLFVFSHFKESGKGAESKNPQWTCDLPVFNRELTSVHNYIAFSFWVSHDRNLNKQLSFGCRFSRYPEKIKGYLGKHHLTLLKTKQNNT